MSTYGFRNLMGLIQEAFHYRDRVIGFQHDCDVGLEEPSHYTDVLRRADLARDALVAELTTLDELVTAGAQDKRRLDAIERGEIEVESMGTTVPYQWVHGKRQDVVANGTATTPLTLRQAIDRALEY